MTTPPPDIPTVADLRTAIERAAFYGNPAACLYVPPGYNGPVIVEGVAVEIDIDATYATLEAWDGSRSRLDGAPVDAAETPMEAANAG